MSINTAAITSKHSLALRIIAQKKVKLPDTSVLERSEKLKVSPTSTELKNQKIK